MIEMVMGARVNGKLVRLDDERRNLPAPDATGKNAGKASGKEVVAE